MRHSNGYKFAAASADEPIVFGAARAGYSDRQVRDWIEFMQAQNIQRVCCLLTRSQLDRYSDLAGIYRSSFGIDRICWAPIEDFQIPDPQLLIDLILPFLDLADRSHEKVVVHCSGGVGRTGIILAAWLVARRKFSPKLAIANVKKTGRNPAEAVIVAPFFGRNSWQVSAELNDLLDTVGG
ncbi:dual specificity protein phosphatase family protein [Chamaesiphon sp. GL140_3_metabinner_50]|uniref:protein-tyrosine phosphatase family protein n=1 Tax=Chamaesiphon sp. GL140_3_metabinner_50 TaxID=2970812 RepID=UPI0025E9C271|nr:dual specificity protein phosphatase family protein [Chamaesiphon sp. GL140_3_metabinner_50]